MPQQSTPKPKSSPTRKHDPWAQPGTRAPQNEGEGSRSAARRYDAGAQHAASDPKRVEELAKKAETALDGSEGKALREAESRGKNAEHR
jgi:hypothetical protein